jgi:hypothetical protein
VTCPLDSAGESRRKENVYSEGKLNQRCKYVRRKEMERGHEYDVGENKIARAIVAWQNPRPRVATLSLRGGQIGTIALTWSWCLVGIRVWRWV